MADLNQIYSPGITPLLQAQMANLMRQPSDANTAQSYQGLLNTLGQLQAKKNASGPLDGLGSMLPALSQIFGSSGGGAGAGDGMLV